MRKGPAVGIDLGTTSACVAVCADGVVRVLRPKRGPGALRSVVGTDAAGGILVGDSEAPASGSLFGAKRLIGGRPGARVGRYTYELLDGDDGDVAVRLRGRVLTLEDACAAVLEALIAHAEASLGQPVGAAVLTVPAYFNEAQRQTVRRAAERAGLPVLQLLHEPTAAAIAWVAGSPLEESARVAVLDLGGGTFDVALLEVHAGEVAVRAVGGDTFLGGLDFDARVVTWALERIHARSGLDLSQDVDVVGRLHAAAEACKIRLSEVDTAEIALGEGIPAVTLSRRELETLTEDLVDRMEGLVRQALARAGWGPADLQRLLVVGGQSRMPRVRAQARAWFGLAPEEGLDADEAVVQGAARLAAALTGQAPAAAVTDVLAESIGVEGPYGEMVRLFAEGCPLPAIVERTLTTREEGQRTLWVRLRQGELPRWSDNAPLGAFELHGVRAAPAGEARVVARFSLDSSGMLEVGAGTAEGPLVVRPWRGRNA